MHGGILKILLKQGTVLSLDLLQLGAASGDGIYFIVGAGLIPAPKVLSSYSHGKAVYDRSVENS